MELVYPPVALTFTTLYRVMGWQIDIRGTEHIPARGPTVIATNHVGYLDFTFIGYAARQRGRLVRFLAKREVFDKPLIGWGMRNMGHICVDRYGGASASKDAAVAALRSGECIGLHPEGTISRSFVPMAARTGAVRMAMEAGAVLVPGAVWGSQRFATKGRKRNWQRGLAITVVFGPPITWTPDEDAGVVNKRLMGAIGGLVEQAAATYPQKPASDEDRWWQPAHLGGTAPTVEETERLSATERAERRRKRRGR